MIASLRTKDLVFLSVLVSLAYISVYFIRIPILPAAPFLRYDIKDIIIVIGGFLYGPLAALAVAFVVGLLQMFTVSEYGVIGFLMTFISTISFVCTASVIYKFKNNQWGAVVGLLTGCISMTIIMLLWNYMITPLYMGVPRHVVATMLIPVFLPFNLLTSVFNSAITLVIFKPIVKALQLSGIKPQHTSANEDKNTFSFGIVVVAAVIAISGFILVLVLQDFI